MAKGSSGFSGGGGGSAGVTAAQDKAINSIANKTRNLKNEQYRIIDEDGNVVLKNQGKEHEVAVKIGDKRDLLSGAVSIHNHPNGGTFSKADLNDFGYGAREIVVASPEGTYKLANINYNTKQKYNGWYDMSEAMDKAGLTSEKSSLYFKNIAREMPNVKKAAAASQKLSEQWVAAKKAGKSQSTLDAIAKKFEVKEAAYKALLAKETRNAEVKPYHDFYKQNASKYGFSYSFTPKK